MFKDLQKDLEKNLFCKNSKIKNPLEFENYKELSNLMENENELKTIALGELSENPKNSKKMQKNYFPLDFFKEFENYGHLTPIGLKTLQATRNGILALKNDDLIKNEQKVDEINKRIPSLIEKY